MKNYPACKWLNILITKRRGYSNIKNHNIYQTNVINSKWVWSGNNTITNRRQPHGTARKSRSTITRHQEDKLSKATSSLFPIKMIAILEWTWSNVQQNIEQLQTPTINLKQLVLISKVISPPIWIKLSRINLVMYFWDNYIFRLGVAFEFSHANITVTDYEIMDQWPGYVF